MSDKVEKIKEELRLFIVNSKEELEDFRIKFISKKSEIGSLFGEMRNVAPENRKSFGEKVNELKALAQDKFQIHIAALSSGENSAEHHNDLTLPPVNSSFGSIHPLTSTRLKFIEIFERIGFNVSTGPEIEDDWHNFTALNFPENHPAREMQDTFFIEKNPDIALRTHTSSVQVRVMENEKPPIRTLSPGRVFRNEAISARAHCVFHQMEGLYIDKGVSFADLKQTLYHFAKEMFDKDTKVRFRPSYFPFTEPSAEIDISCQICHGDAVTSVNTQVG